MARRKILMLRSPRQRASRSTHHRTALAALCLLLGLAVGTSAPASAQDTVRQVPASRGEAMLSFAPVVKKAAPAVVNIFAKRKVEQRAVPSLLDDPRSEEHTSELQSLMRISYAVFCLKKKKTKSRIYHSFLYILLINKS